jgi:hypothetical protein
MIATFATLSLWMIATLATNKKIPKKNALVLSSLVYLGTRGVLFIVSVVTSLVRDDEDHPSIIHRRKILGRERRSRVVCLQRGSDWESCRAVVVSVTASSRVSSFFWPSPDAAISATPTFPVGAIFLLFFEAGSVEKGNRLFFLGGGKKNH